MSEAVSRQPSAVSQDETIEIPVTVLVRCPLVGYRLRRISGHCPTCQHFRGLGDRFPGSKEMSFSARYHIRCAAEPVKRELFEVA